MLGLGRADILTFGYGDYSGNSSIQSFVLFKYTQDGTLLSTKEFASHQNGAYSAICIVVDNQDAAVSPTRRASSSRAIGSSTL